MTRDATPEEQIAEARRTLDEIRLRWTPSSRYRAELRDAARRLRSLEEAHAGKPAPIDPRGKTPKISESCIDR